MLITTRKEPKSTRASYVPGDTLRRLTYPILDTAGKTWPAGCTFRLQSAGRDNVSNADYWSLSIISTPKETT